MQETPRKPARMPQRQSPGHSTQRPWPRCGGTTRVLDVQRSQLS
ncbi:hypothetical protein ACFOLD_10500 [Kocuria carniphila]